MVRRLPRRADALGGTTLVQLVELTKRVEEPLGWAGLITRLDSRFALFLFVVEEVARVPGSEVVWHEPTVGARPVTDRTSESIVPVRDDA
jgi:hypothetical protein